MARDPDRGREEIAPTVTNSFVVSLVSLVHLVSLVYPVSLVHPNKRDKLNKPDEPEKPDRPERRGNNGIDQNTASRVSRRAV